MKIVLLNVFVFSFILAKGQTDSTNIYYQAIKYYNVYLEELRSSERDIFIEKNRELTEMLPSTIGNRNIILLTLANSTDQHKKNRNRIKYIKVFPGEIREDKVSVKLIPHYSEYRGKESGFSVSVSDHLTIHFQFDCNTRRYKYVSTSGQMPLDLYRK